MGSLIIPLTFTLTTLLVLAASNPWGSTPFNWRLLPCNYSGSPPSNMPPPSANFPGSPPFNWPPPSANFPGSPPFNMPPPSANFPGWPPFNMPPPSANFPGWPPFRPPRVDFKKFYRCMRSYEVPLSDFYAPNINKNLFTSVLNSTAQNFRCLGNNIHKPLFIFRPTEENQVPPAVLCARMYNLNIRVRSGGHDYECLSYISLMKNHKFMILDLFELRNVDINIRKRTAWVQAGATIGELYYKISQASNELAFPAGLCSSLGVGGHLTGGAYGSMMRRFGLGADHVLDVRIVDACGNVRTKEDGSMDKQFFWALRGGGGGSYGVILAWKIKLVKVPPKVTMFTVMKTLEQNGTNTLDRWQRVAPEIDPKLFIRVIMQPFPLTDSVIFIYQALYLGDADNMVRVMKKNFTELGVNSVSNCTEMSWIESVMVFAGFNTTIFKPDYLLQGKPAFSTYNFKAKSDFVYHHIPTYAFNGIWKIFKKFSPQTVMIFNPYGGKMRNISVNETPFPHRQALYKIQYSATWVNHTAKIQLETEDLLRVLYDYMTPYVSTKPRQAYVNYRDLDIGKNVTGSNCSYPDTWGPKYFLDNYQTLVDVKSRVDSSNFFRNEQSMPTKRVQKQCTEVI